MSDTDVQLYAGQTYDPIITVTLASLIDTDSMSPTYNPTGLVDLTGWRLRAAFKTKPDPSLTPLAEVDTDASGFTILTQTALPWAAGSTLGQAQANFTPAQTAALPLRRLWVDFWGSPDDVIWRQLVAPYVVHVRAGVVEPLE